MSKEFENLYRKDQESIKDWSKDKIADKEFYIINSELRKKVNSLLKSKNKISGKDYFVAAMIFHHTYKLSASKKAVQLAKVSG